MFGRTSKALLTSLGADEDLIYNENVNQEIKMLTLVKVRQKPLWPVVEYTFTGLTLPDLLQSDISPEYTEKVLLEDFNNLRDSSGGGLAAAGVNAANLEMGAATDAVDGVTPITLMTKKVDTEKLNRSCTNKSIEEQMLDRLKLKKTEKLAFVDQMVYNTGSVTFFGKAGKSGLVSAVCDKFRCSLWSKRKRQRSFTISKDTTFAFRLMEITTEDKTLGIPARFSKMTRYKKGFGISTDGDNDKLERVMEEIFDRAELLQPLGELPKARRHDLLETLIDLLQDRDALTLLEETLDQSIKGVFECPQSQAVSPFMDLLDVPEVSTDQKDAAHLLVRSMDTLPDDAAILLATCSPETLRVLQQLVTSLKEGTEARLPEPLPDALQEEGELRWAEEILRAANETPTELKDQWDTPEFPPQVLLELVCLVVQGLSLMRHETRS